MFNLFISQMLQFPSFKNYPYLLKNLRFKEQNWNIQYTVVYSYLTVFILF